MLRVISLGAGVQSTAMAMMAARGEISPMPDGAIFADTQGEAGATYKHLSWLRDTLPFPVHDMTRGNLIERMLSGDDEARIPFFVGRGGMAKRQCTRNYKLKPIRRKIRELLGAGPREFLPPGSAESWIGITVDEAIRVKPSGLR